jgi:hypothetical protein
MMRVGFFKVRPEQVERKQVLAEVREGPAEVELLFDIRAEGE